MNYWPDGLPRQATIESFAMAFQLLGWGVCATGELEDAREKVALYVKGGDVTHAARQLPSGLWVSKLGREEDIEHSLEDLDGGFYGSATQFFDRAIG